MKLLEIQPPSIFKAFFEAECNVIVIHMWVTLEISYSGYQKQCYEEEFKSLGPDDSGRALCYIPCRWLLMHESRLPGAAMDGHAQGFCIFVWIMFGHGLAVVPNTLDNFQLLCRSCNSSKNNSEDDKWDFRYLFPDFYSNAQQYEKDYVTRTDHDLYFECIPSESHQTSIMKWLYNATEDDISNNIDKQDALDQIESAYNVEVEIDDDDKSDSKPAAKVAALVKKAAVVKKATPVKKPAPAKTRVPKSNKIPVTKGSQKNMATYFSINKE